MTASGGAPADAQHDDAAVFTCDLCDKTWPRYEWTTTVLRVMVAHHLWVVHAVKGTDVECMLPMTDKQVAWVRDQRVSGE